MRTKALELQEAMEELCKMPLDVRRPSLPHPLVLVLIAPSPSLSLSRPWFCVSNSLGQCCRWCNPPPHSPDTRTYRPLHSEMPVLHLADSRSTLAASRSPPQKGSWRSASWAATGSR